MKKRLLITVIAVLTLATMLVLTSCGNETANTTEGVGTTAEPVVTTARSPATTTSPSDVDDDLIDISKYTIIRSETSSKEIVNILKSLKNEINTELGYELEVKTDEIRKGQTFDPTLPEILIGKTNRLESEEAWELLNASADNDYYIGVKGPKFIIIGKDDKSTLYAAREFLTTFIYTKITDGKLDIKEDSFLMKKVEENGTLLNSFATVDTVMTSTILSSSKGSQYWPTYGRILELQHNGENNGILYATSQWAGSSFPIFRSTDGGKNWRYFSSVEEQFQPNLIGNWQPHIFELPNQVGDMPEGTLLVSGCTHDANTEKITLMCIWKSTDLGKTWEEISVVDQGNGLSDGMYEPFLICDEDGSLVCFYSDETEVSDQGGQRLVFKVSKDGINWGEKQYCVAPKAKNLRPGMVTVAKMGDNGYILAYEMIGQTGGPVYTKVSDSLTDWGDPADVGKVVSAGAGTYTGCTPYIVWTPQGGEYGTVITAGRFGGSPSSHKEMSDLFMSFDLGKTWYTYTNPLPFDYHESSNANYAYSFGFGLAADGSVYYINNVFPDNPNHKYVYSDLKVAKMQIKSVKEYAEIK